MVLWRQCWLLCKHLQWMKFRKFHYKMKYKLIWIGQSNSLLQTICWECQKLKPREWIDWTPSVTLKKSMLWHPANDYMKEWKHELTWELTNYLQRLYFGQSIIFQNGTIMTVIAFVIMRLFLTTNQHHKFSQFCAFM